MNSGRELVVLMGPSGCGKTTVGRLLAEALGRPFIEGDDYHPPSNKQKMAAGQALGDPDRKAWIDALVTECRNHPATSLVLACSALTPYVQSRLGRECGRRICFVLLEVPRAELIDRLRTREGHFMPAELADSQLAALVPPGDAMKLDATLELQHLVSGLCEALGHRSDQENDGKAGQSHDSGR